MEPRPDFDLTNPECFVTGDPHAMLKWLRHNAPLSRISDAEGRSYWVVTKYADAVKVYRTPLVFSSEGPIVMSIPSDRAGVGQSMIVSDPPRHRQLRGFVKWSFTPRAVAKWEGLVRSVVRQLIAEAVDKGECDFVLDVATRLVVDVFFAILGVPPADRQRLAHLEDMISRLDDPEFQLAPVADATPEKLAKMAFETVMYANREMAMYYIQLIAERRKIGPQDDIIDLFTFGTIDGVPLTQMETLQNLSLLTAGGLETTINASGSGLYALLTYRDQLERLRSNPALVNSAVEEILRYVTPTFHFLRTVAKDTELRGQQLRQGDLLALFLASINRDEEVFLEPDRFDVGRTPNDHLAFGYGEHFCLGANLARLELRVLMQELAPHLGDIELNGPVSRTRSVVVPGVKHLPIRFKTGRIPARSVA
ncbi:MAG TPA: cytochrome P450 [Candidatus Binataceae bacterium]|nr:cytochrome P450 [Candidatus Binataceae bacterium]